MRSNNKELQDAVKATKIAQEKESANDFDSAIESYKTALDIKTKHFPDSLDLANIHNKIASLYHKRNQLDEAVFHYIQEIKIRENKDQNSENLAIAYESIGEVYLDKKEITEALKFNLKALDIKKQIVATNNTAVLYNKIGMIFSLQSDWSKALDYYLNALRIQEELDNKTSNLFTYYNNIAAVYNALGNQDEAQKYYNLALECHEKSEKTNDHNAAYYNNLGSNFRSRGDNNTALENYQRAVELQLAQNPDSIEIATYYNNIGTVLSEQDDSDAALNYYLDALAIEKRLKPNSVNIAFYNSNIAAIYINIGKLDEALELLRDAYEIAQKNLISIHPNLVIIAYNIAKTSTSLQQNDIALEYANLAIGKDCNFKFAYNLKGVILAKQGRTTEALESFELALKIDPNYADAKLHRLELFTKMGKPSSFIANEAREAIKLFKTNFDANYQNGLQAKSDLSGHQGFRINLPRPEYEAGSTQYLDKVAILITSVEKLQASIDQTGSRVDSVEARLDNLEDRMDILDRRLYQLSHSMNIIQRSQNDLDKAIKANESNAELVKELKLEKEKLTKREALIKDFNKNTDLRHYYHSFLSELEAMYIAAQAVSSRKIVATQSTKYSKAAGYVGMLASIIPVVGNLAEKIIGGMGSAVDLYANTKDKEELLRIKDIASTIGEFDAIALRLAVDFTLANMEQIRNLNGAIIEPGWQDHVRDLLKGNIKSLMEEFIGYNKTKAQLLGRTDGHRVIVFLQEEAVSENLSYVEEDREANKSRFSMVSNEILREVYMRDVQNKGIAHSAFINHQGNPLILGSSTQNFDTELSGSYQQRIDSERSKGSCSKCIIL